MNATRYALLLVAVAALAVGCRSWRYPKKAPDLYQIDCNVPYAEVYVFDAGGKLISQQKAGESFKRLDTNGHVEVKADGYISYSGPVSNLEVIGKKSWYVKLRRGYPGG